MDWQTLNQKNLKIQMAKKRKEKLLQEIAIIDKYLKSERTAIWWGNKQKEKIDELR